MKPILALALVFSAVNATRAEDLVFETRQARLAIRPDAVVRSLIEKQNGKELLRPGKLAFASVRKGGRFFPASAADRRGDLLHVTFGASGVDAEYRITPRAEYIVVELTAFHGDGIEEIRLMQLNLSLANAGGTLGVRWDNEFAVCLMGLGPRVESGFTGEVLRASVYPELSMLGERVVIVAGPTPHFLERIRNVERDFHLPSPTLGGTWAKLSQDVRTSYLFTDLTEANADETIRYAKQGGFRYILVYNDTWSASPGSYPINTRSFPRGEASLKAVIDKCHTAGLKVGMHMLTSVVGKNDPLAAPKPNPGLLKDAEATLASDVTGDEKELAVASSPTGFPSNPNAVYGAASDIQIDDEIIHYGALGNTGFTQCVRGSSGTKPAPHKAGSKIYHLLEFFDAYVADLKTPLKDVISNRVSGLINRCGFDMIFFDGVELNGATKPGWYWMSMQQMPIWEKSRRDLLVEGNVTPGWAWHISSRGMSDDYAAVAPKPYLDYHKIADYWNSYHTDFLPADLGWVGFLTDAPDHPATKPDEVEYYAARMLALDTPASFETTLNALKANGRTPEMLKLLGQYEQLRLAGVVPKAVRQQLASGEWHMTRPGEFHPIRYDPHRSTVPGEIIVRNDFPAQPLKFRLQTVSALAPVGDPLNIPLLEGAPPIEIPPPDAKAAMPGSLVRRFEFPTPLDLTKHRALAVRLDVEGLPSGSGESAVLNVQLEAGGNFYRDYYVDLNAAGLATIILTEPGTNRMMADFRAAGQNYYFKNAMIAFNYTNIVALNLRWMRYPKGSGIRTRIGLVEALDERDGTISDVEISAGSSSITIPAAMKTGDYAEYWGDATIRVFDRNGVTLSTFPAPSGPQLATGENKLTVKAVGPGDVVLTAITLGK